MSAAEVYESLGKCVEALNLGSPSPPPTVRKIRNKSNTSPQPVSPTASPKLVSPTASPKTKSPTKSPKLVSPTASLETKSPVSKSEDVSSETPSLDISKVIKALKEGEKTPVLEFPFPLPDYRKMLVQFDVSTLVDWENFPLRKYFEKVANVILDTDVQKKDTTTKKAGGKARKTCIRFSPTIAPKSWREDEVEWIYIFLVDGKIVKIGGTRTGLLKRCGSYLSGHGIPELNGTLMSTNAYIYWTFLHLLLQGKEVEMYACKLPEAIVTQTVFGTTRSIKTQCFHDWEAYCLEEFRNSYGSFPPLSDNCDPRHRKEKKGKTASKK
jgi:hypothetical protein